MHKFAASLFLLAAVSPAHAYTYCVATSAALSDALFQAHATSIIDPSASIDIRIKRSAEPYVIQTVPNSDYDASFGELSLRGGYSSSAADNCTAANRVTDANATTIEYAGEPNNFYLIADSFFVEAFTFKGGERLRLLRSTVGSGSVVVQNNIFATKAGGLSTEYDGAPPDVRVVNNVFHGNTDAQRCELELNGEFFNPGGDAVVANNTIAGSAGPGACVKSLASVWFQNNIVWGNNAGIVDRNTDDPTTLTLLYNLLQTPNTMPGLVGGHPGALAGNPQFEPGGFRLLVSSPAINSGSPGAVPAGLPSKDVAGNTRVVGGVVDRGAYESLVADNEEYVVNTLQDTLDTSNGKLSLRSALQLANADPGPEVISFAIPSACPATIVLDAALGALPDITGDVIIDAYTQPGSSVNTSAGSFNGVVCVGLDGNWISRGLRVPAGATGTLTVRGLRFQEFDGPVVLESGEGHSIAGNVFSNPPGPEFDNCVRIVGTAKNVLIGGASLNDRNFCSDGYLGGVYILSDQNFVMNNLFAPQAGGYGGSSYDNRYGLIIEGDGNRVEQNLIIDSTFSGIEVAGSGNTISGNTLSANEYGVSLSPSNAGGLASNNVIKGNFITGNASAGIRVTDNAVNNRLLSNRVFDNAGLGIDLSPLGQVNANDGDTGVVSTRGNRSINFPVIVSAQTLAGNPSTTAQALGSLSSANGNFTVQFFASSTCDESGHGEAEELVGSLTLSITTAGQFSNGTKGFSAPLLSGAPLAGRYLSATATDASGNTSELGPCFRVAGPIFHDGFE